MEERVRASTRPSEKTESEYETCYQEASRADLNLARSSIVFEPSQETSNDMSAGKSNLGDESGIPANTQRSGRRAVNSQYHYLHKIIKKNHHLLIEGKKLREYTGWGTYRGMEGPYGVKIDASLDAIEEQKGLGRIVQDLNDPLVLAGYQQFLETWRRDWSLRETTLYIQALSEEHDRVRESLFSRNMSITSAEPLSAEQPGTEKNAGQGEYISADLANRIESLPMRQKSANAHSDFPRSIASLVNSAMLANQDLDNMSGPASNATLTEVQACDRQEGPPLTGTAPAFEQTPPQAIETMSQRNSSIFQSTEGSLSLVDDGTAKVEIRLKPEGAANMQTRRMYWYPGQTRDEFFQGVSQRFVGKIVRSVAVDVNGEDFYVEPVGSMDEWMMVRNELMSARGRVGAEVRMD